MAEIFDKIIGGLHRGVATVGTSSKAMVEKAKIKTEIKGLETERKHLAELLGMKVYEQQINSGEIVVDESMMNFIAEISKRMEKVSEKQEEIRRIDSEMSQLGNAEESHSYSEDACTCGNLLPQGAKFCVKCGKSIINEGE